MCWSSANHYSIRVSCLCIARLISSSHSRSLLMRLLFYKYRHMHNHYPINSDEAKTSQYGLEVDANSW